MFWFFISSYLISSVSCRVVFPHVPQTISRDRLIPDECEYEKCVNNGRKDRYNESKVDRLILNMRLCRVCIYDLFFPTLYLVRLEDLQDLQDLEQDPEITPGLFEG